MPHVSSPLVPILHEKEENAQHQIIPFEKIRRIQNSVDKTNQRARTALQIFHVFPLSSFDARIHSHLFCVLKIHTAQDTGCHSPYTAIQSKQRFKWYLLCDIFVISLIFFFSLPCQCCCSATTRKKRSPSTSLAYNNVTGRHQPDRKKEIKSLKWDIHILNLYKILTYGVCIYHRTWMMTLKLHQPFYMCMTIRNEAKIYAMKAIVMYSELPHEQHKDRQISFRCLTDPQSRINNTKGEERRRSIYNMKKRKEALY